MSWTSFKTSINDGEIPWNPHVYGTLCEARTASSSPWSAKRSNAPTPWAFWRIGDGWASSPRVESEGSGRFVFFFLIDRYNIYIIIYIHMIIYRIIYIYGGFLKSGYPKPSRISKIWMTMTRCIETTMVTFGDLSWHKKPPHRLLSDKVLWYPKIYLQR
jgi:hypothetical protein